MEEIGKTYKIPDRYDDGGRELAKFCKILKHDSESQPWNVELGRVAPNVAATILIEEEIVGEVRVSGSVYAEDEGLCAFLSEYEPQTTSSRS